MNLSALIPPLASIALLFACHTGETPAASPEAQHLVFSAGELHLEQNGERRLLGSFPDCRSFTSFNAAGCLVITSLDDTLQPDSWVIGPAVDPATALHLPGQLLEYAAADHLAFTSLPDPLLELPGELNIVNDRGRLLLEHLQAWPLRPEDAADSSGEIWLLEWDALDEYSGLLEAPHVRLCSSADGTTQLDWRLPLDVPISDANLLHVGSTGAILLVQFDIYHWQLLLLDRAEEKAKVIHSLDGQPMFDRLLPSGSDRFSHLQLSAAGLELDVISFAEGNLRLLIDPLTGKVTEKSITDSFPRNRNLPLAGSINSSKGLHLSQQLIPLQMGNEWRQDALLDESGRVLILTSEGPSWLPLR